MEGSEPEFFFSISEYRSIFSPFLNTEVENKTSCMYEIFFSPYFVNTELEKKTSSAYVCMYTNKIIDLGSFGYGRVNMLLT